MVLRWSLPRLCPTSPVYQPRWSLQPKLVKHRILWEIHLKSFWLKLHSLLQPNSAEPLQAPGSFCFFLWFFPMRAFRSMSMITDPLFHFQDKSCQIGQNFCFSMIWEFLKFFIWFDQSFFQLLYINEQCNKSNARFEDSWGQNDH